MKNNYKKYFYLLFIIFTCLQSKAQVLFLEDFGTNTSRVSSPFVPQAGEDFSLPISPYTCSSFYKSAHEHYTIVPSCLSTLSAANDYINRISDGYYTIVDPRGKINNGSSLLTLPNWARTGLELGNSGAVLIVNAGEIKNQYYRRATVLQPNTTYRVSFKLMLSGSTRFGSQIEIQSLISEQVLGQSPVFGDRTANVWHTLSWTFKTSPTLACDSKYAVAIRNVLQLDSGNDFYIDDIKLEIVPDINSITINCNPSNNGTIGANDNRIPYRQETTNDVLSNDLYIDNGATVPVVVSGSNANASITQIGNWPNGFSLNADGQLVISNGAIMPTTPLQYQICSLGANPICSTANIVLYSGTDLSVRLEVESPCTIGNVDSNYNLVLKNSGTEPVTLNTNNKATITIPVSSNKPFDGFSLALIDYEKDNWNIRRVIYPNTIYTLTYPKTGSVVLQPGEERILSLKQEIVSNGIFNLTATLSFPTDNNVNNNTSTASVEKLAAPTAINRNNLIVNASYTLYQATGLPQADFDKYLFYKNGNLISGNTTLNLNDLTGYTYSAYSSSNTICRESIQSTITLRLNVYPFPGVIGINSNYVCKNSSVVITNLELGSSSGLAGLTRYSWEFSYDNGITWNVFGDNQRTQGEQIIEVNSETITIDNVQKSFLIRRKITERSINIGNFNYSNVISVNVVKPDVLFDGKGLYDTPKGNNSLAKMVNSTVVFPTFSLRNTNGVVNGGTITVKNELGVEVGTSTTGSITIPDRVFNAVGYYQYKIEYSENTSLGCSGFEYFNVTIYDAADCNKYNKKIFATITDSSQFSVDDELLAADEDLSTASTIVGVSLLGLGPNQKIKFDPTKFKHADGTQYSSTEAPIKKGTRVILKFGQEYSAIGLIGAVSLYPIDNSNDRISGYNVIGTPIEGALLDLLPADNVFEYSYIAPVDMWGLEIYYGAVLAIGSNYKVYGMYVEAEESIIPNSTSHCGNNVVVTGAKLPLSTTIYKNVDTGLQITFPSNNIQLNKTVSDINWGVQDIGLGVASSLASVLYPYLAVDDSYETYAIFNKTVAALNRQFLDVKFNQTGRQGDQIQILLSNSGIDILSLNLLSDFKAQRYLGDVPVGDEVSLNDTSLVKLSLFWMDGRRRAAVILPSDLPFDRVRLSYLSIVQVSLGDYTYIHDISLLPSLQFDGFGELDNTTICAAEPLLIEKMEACTSYNISLAFKNNQNAIEDIPLSTLSSNNQLIEIDNKDYFKFNFTRIFPEHDNLYLKVQALRKDCPLGEPQYFSIDLKNCNSPIVNPVLRTTAEKK